MGNDIVVRFRKGVSGEGGRGAGPTSNWVQIAGLSTYTTARGGIKHSQLGWCGNRKNLEKPYSVDILNERVPRYNISWERGFKKRVGGERTTKKGQFQNLHAMDA